MRQIVLDTETTGLYAAAGDRIIEIGCVELVNRRRTGNDLHLYINPERDSHEEALRIHGITTEFLADKPKFKQIVEQLQTYLAGAELVIHNATFDVGFLNAELKGCKQPPLETHVGKIIDTLKLAKELFPGKRNSLDTLCERFGINNTNRVLHGALLDAQLLADVYICMTRGQNALLMTETAVTTNSAGSAAGLQQLELPVLLADAAELLEHEKMLAMVDKKSNAKTLWRK